MSINNSNHNSEKAESDINKSKNNKDLLKNEFLQSFKDEVFSYEKKKKLNYLDKIKHTSDNITTPENDEVKSLIISLQAKNDKYSSLNIDDIKMSEVKEKFNFENRALELWRESLVKIFDSEYEIDKKFNEEQIKPLLKNKDLWELRVLIGSKKSRKEFLIENLKNKAPQQKIKFGSELVNLFMKDIKNVRKDKTFPKEIHEKIDYVSVFLGDSKNIKFSGEDASIFAELLDLNILSLKTITKILEEYLPTISLADMINYWLLTEQEALRMIKNRDEYTHIPDSKWINSGLFDIIYVETSFHLNNTANIAKFLKSKAKDSDLTISDLLASKIAEDYNLDLEDLEEKAWEKEQKFKNLDSFKKILKKEKLKNVNNIDSLQEWSFFEEKTKSQDWKIVSTFYKIVKLEDSPIEAWFYLLWVGEGDKISLSASWDWDLHHYSVFLDYLKIEKKPLTFYTEEEMKARVDSPTDKLNTYDFERLTKAIFDGEKKDDYINFYKEYKQKEINKLKDELQLLENENRLNPSSVLATKIALLEQQIQDLEDSILDHNIDENDVLDELNFIKLLERINALDSDWVDLGLETWMFLESDKWWTYELTWISKDTWKIEVSSFILKTKEEFSYEEFIENFIKTKTKRVPKIKDFNDLINFQEKDKDIGNAWGKTEFKNGMFLKKRGEEDKDKQDEDLEIEYFVDEESGSIIQVEKIEWDKVFIKHWLKRTREELFKDENNGKFWLDPNKSFFGPGKISRKEKHKAKLKQEVLLMQTEPAIEYNLNEFKKIIKTKKRNYLPSPETGKKNEAKEEEHNKFKWNFFGRFKNWYSISSFISAWEMYVSWVKDYLKKDNDLRAAKLALKWNWALWLVSEELASEMLIKIERHESEAMDKELESLKQVDSPIATTRIKKWLSNKNTPEYKKEAWLMFMYEAYWVLYAKKLDSYRWKFLWYEAFGGKIWDALYREEEAKAKKDDVGFSEEKLMHVLLSRQCKDKWWYNWVKRRSRLYKALDAKWSKWIDDDLEKWYGDASRMRNAKNMVNYWMWEGENGTYANAIWAFKKTIEAGASAELMNEWFFSLMFSWVFYKVDQKITDKVKALWLSGMPIVTLLFATKKSHIELFNKTILELSKDMTEAYRWKFDWKFDNMYKEAKNIFDNAYTNKWNEEDKVKKARGFWKKYGKPLSNALSNSHTGDLTYAKTDKIIYLNKDWKYKDYYKLLNEHSTWDFTFNNDYMSDAAWAEWLWWINTRGAVAKYFKKNPDGTFRDPGSSKELLEKISSDIDATRDRVFSEDEDENYKLKRQYLDWILKELIGAILSNSGSQEQVLKAYNLWDTWYTFNNWWLNIKENFENINYSEKLLLDWKADNEINRIIDNILGRKWWNHAFGTAWKFWSTINDILDN